MTWSTDAIVPVTSLINHESFAAIYVIIGLRDAKKAMKAAREEITGLEASSNCFHLRRTLEPERTYHSCMGEACAGVWAIDKFRPYIHGRKRIHLAHGLFRTEEFFHRRQHPNSHDTEVEDATSEI